MIARVSEWLNMALVVYTAGTAVVAVIVWAVEWVLMRPEQRRRERQWAEWRSYRDRIREDRWQW